MQFKRSGPGSWKARRVTYDSSIGQQAYSTYFIIAVINILRDYIFNNLYINNCISNLIYM